MSTELETLQENTQRLTNVMDDYLDVVRDSLSGMADKVSRLAGSIHGGGSSEGTLSGDFQEILDEFDSVNFTLCNIDNNVKICKKTLNNLYRKADETLYSFEEVNDQLSSLVDELSGSNDSEIYSDMIEILQPLV